MPGFLCMKKRKKQLKNRRKISAKEAARSYILILKEEIGKSPFIGKNFKMLHGGKPYAVIVKAIPCVCAYSDHPHKHFHLKVNFHELKSGDLVEITQDSEEGYILKVDDFFRSYHAIK
jgi:hypothetical protein